MGEVKQINIKNRTYSFYNDIIDIKNFDERLLKIDKKSYKNISIYNIGYMTIDDCKHIHSVNPLYLHIDHANGYIEEKGVNKYLVFDSTDENKELLKKYSDVFDGVRDKIKKVSSDECDIWFWLFQDIGFKYENYVCNGFHDLIQKAMNVNNVAIVYVKRNAYRIHFWYISKNDVINIINSSNLVDKRSILQTFFLINFLLYIKISENTDLTYYQKTRDMILNRGKDYYKNSKEILRVRERDKYRNLSEEEKNENREYGKNRYRNMSEGKKQRLKQYQKKVSKKLS